MLRLSGFNRHPIRRMMPSAKPVAGFFWLCILLALTMQDYYTHGWGEEAPVEFLKQGLFVRSFRHFKYLTTEITNFFSQRIFKLSCDILISKLSVY